MGFISYCMSLSLYIMSSYLKHYSVLLNLILQMHAGQRSMCGVIVVDAGRSWSTCHGHDAHVHDHCLRYHHNFALLYQLLGSNLFTHLLFAILREASSETYGPRVYLLSYLLSIYFYLHLYFLHLYYKIPKIYLSYLTIFIRSHFRKWP